ncbi:MAG: hypothetical protein ACE5KU_05715 [Nitrososphaerales archaeon]
MVREENPLLVQDDFSRDPGSEWIFLNAAYWDSGSEHIVLTEPGSDLVGVMWLKKNVTSPFTVEFRYRVGGGSGADGFVFMFYKDWDYEPGIGGFLGFHCREVDRPCPRKEAPGYGLEFDNYFNSKEEYGEVYGEGDPSPNHVALLKDFIGNHLTHVNDSRTEDNLWHHVKLIVRDEGMTASIDGEETLTWAGSFDRSNDHMGFGSGIWGYDHRHAIDDFKLYGNTITVKGLQPGWTVELLSDSDLLGRTVVPPDDVKAVLDVSELPVPLKGYFKVYKETELVFESPTFDEIWGGDVWSLRTATSEQPSTQVTGYQWDTQTIAVMISVVALILLISFLIYSRRRTA